MADQVVADVNGLQVSNGTFSSSPPGSLQTAEECVMPQKSVIEPRRGQERSTVTPNANQTPMAMVEFQGEIITNCGVDKSDTSYDLALGDDEYSGGPYNPVDDDGSNESYGRMAFGQGGGFLHFCTTTGPKCLEDAGDTPRAAGLLQMPDPTAEVTKYAGNNWLPYRSSVAIRVVNRRITSTGVPLLSPPSGPLIVTNRALIPIGNLTKAASVATAVLAPNSQMFLQVGQTFELTPGEADFPPATYTILSVGAGPSFTFAITAGTASSTFEQDADVGARGIGVAAVLPTDAIEGDVIREYRSPSTSTTTPSDELLLANEAAVGATEISNGAVVINDTTPQSVLIDPLYTNQLNGAGALQANYQPPIYRDLAFWQDRMWYAQTTQQHSISLEMLGVGSPGGVQDGDTLTVADGSTTVSVTFKNTPAGDSDVQIYSGGTFGQNVDATCRALIQVFLLEFPDGWAAYLEGNGTLPGKFRIQRTDFGGAALGITASRSATWTPALDASTPVDSVAEYIPNGLSYSKLDESEAVPLVNTTTVGSSNYAAVRILGLQQSLLVFKQGDGIYTVSGVEPFQVQQASTANIIAPGAAVVFADNAWVYTDQGILRISNSGGSTVISRPIETELNELRARFPDETYDWAFAVAYETERRVLFFVPFSVDADGRPLLKAWCFNNATNAWTGPLYGRGAFSGVASLTAGKLALGVFDEEFSTGRVTLERKGNGYMDYADADFSNSITAIDVGGDPLVVTLNSVVDVEAGDGIEQGNYRTKIASIDGNDVTLYEEVPFLATTCSIYKHYNVSLSFLPTGNPSARKTLTRLSWLAKPEWFASLTGKTTLLTDACQANNEIDTPFVGFGLNPFGAGVFGDPSPMVVDVNPLDAKWSTAAQFFPGMTISEAWPKLKLQGFSAMIDQSSGPAGRGK